MNTNIVMIQGRLCKDPEIKYSKSGIMFANISLAVNHYSKNKENQPVSFIDITCFSHSAKFLSEYCNKGDEMFIQGELKQDRWLNSDNKQMSRLGVIGHNVQLLRKKGDNNKSETPRGNEPEEQPDLNNTFPAEYDDSNIPF